MDILQSDELKRRTAKLKETDLDFITGAKDKILAKFKDNDILNKFFEIAEVFIDMVKDYRSGTYTVIPWKSIAAIGATLTYVLSPIDLIPDFIPGLGLVDDLGVIGYCLKWVQQDLHAYLDWKLALEKGPIQVQDIADQEV